MKGLAWLLVCLLAACSEPVDDAQFEVAAELRALRLALQQQGGAASPRSSDSARQDVAEALQPLREALEQLVREQRELATRQLLLSQALQQQAEAAGGAARGEVQGLAERLRQVEATLQTQDARHREVEELMGRALDQASERLEQFLQRLPRLPAAAEPPAPPTPTAPAAPGGAPAAEGAAPPAGGAAGGAQKIGHGESVGRPRSREYQQPWWWLVLVAGAAASVLGYCWRLRRQPLALAGPSAGFDRGTEELWTAARLLGEPAVPAGGGHGAASPQVVAAAPVAAALVAATAPTAPLLPEGMAGEEFVIEGLDEVEVDDDTLPAGGTAAAPLLLRWRLPVADAAAAMPRAMAFLAADGRVLRRPAPMVVAGTRCLEVACHVLPSLLPGERTALFLALRGELGPGLAGRRGG